MIWWILGVWCFQSNLSYKGKNKISDENVLCVSFSEDRVAKTHRMPQVAGHFPERPTNHRAPLREMTIMTRHPMGLRHPVLIMTSLIRVL